jgi:hypothetical protein
MKDAEDLTWLHRSRTKHPELRPLSYDELTKDRTHDSWSPEQTAAYVKDRRIFEAILHRRLAAKGIPSDRGNTFLYATLADRERMENKPGGFEHRAPLSADLVNSSFFDVVGDGKSRTMLGPKGLAAALKRWEAAKDNLETSEYMGMKIQPRIEVITPSNVTPASITKATRDNAEKQSAAVMGGLAGSLLGAGAGAYFDRKKRWRGGLLGALGGGLLGGGLGYTQDQKQILRKLWGEGTLLGAEVDRVSPIRAAARDAYLIAVKNKSLLDEAASARNAYELANRGASGEIMSAEDVSRWKEVQARMRKAYRDIYTTPHFGDTEKLKELATPALGKSSSNPEKAALTNEAIGGGLAGSLLGAGVGAYLDRKKRLRGGLLGALAGGVVGGTAGQIHGQNRHIYNATLQRDSEREMLKTLIPYQDAVRATLPFMVRNKQRLEELVKAHQEFEALPDPVDREDPRLLPALDRFDAARAAATTPRDTGNFEPLKLLIR